MPAELIEYFCVCGKRLYTVANLLVSCPGCGRKFVMREIQREHGKEYIAESAA